MKANGESFRSLSNYKQMHQETAKKKGVLTEFNNAKTLTQARIILFGKHVKNCIKFRGHPDWR